MKKLLLSITTVVLLLSVSAQGTMQTTSDKKMADKKEMPKKEMKKSELRDHVCTSACKDGKHVYAHGEKGHKCTAECHKKM